MKSDTLFLMHIRNEIEFIINNTQNANKEIIIANDVLKHALIRSIEIIGEAVKNISSGLKNKYPTIEWKKLAGSRDRLIHGYFVIDYDIIWDIVVNKIPALKEQIEELLKLENIIF